MKKTLLIVGCGKVAFRVAPLLHKRYRLLGLCRKPENICKLRAHAITPILGDLDQPDSLDKLAGIAHAVLHLAPPPSYGLKDPRTTHLLAALTRGTLAKRRILPHRLIYISTSGVYGDCQGSWVSENHPLNPTNERAWRRVNAESQIRNWGLRNDVQVSILRVPGIYAADRLPLARLRQHTPVLSADEDSYTNHIHADDLARIIAAALHHGKSGRVYHASDDSHLKMGDYFDLVADYFGLPRPPRIPRYQANKYISPNLMSFMNESRRLTNNRIKQELRIKLLYPTVAIGITKTIQHESNEVMLLE